MLKRQKNYSCDITLIWKCIIMLHVIINILIKKHRKKKFWIYDSYVNDSEELQYWKSNLLINMLRKCLTQSIVFKSRNVVFIRRKEQKQHAMSVVCYSLCFPSEGSNPGTCCKWILMVMFSSADMHFSTNLNNLTSQWCTSK